MIATLVKLSCSVWAFVGGLVIVDGGSIVVVSEVVAVGCRAICLLHAVVFLL